MQSWHTADTDALFEAILSLQTVDECYRFFEDACTIREITEIARRLQVAKLLYRGVPYTRISQETGASTATISRVKRCLAYGDGGYRTILDRMGKETV